MATITLSHMSLVAGKAWGPVQVTITDPNTTYLSGVARLITPFSSTPGKEQPYTNITLNELLVATATPNVFTLTIRKTEMDKLLSNGLDATAGTKYSKVQILAMAYTTAGTPDPIATVGEQMKSEDIQVHLSAAGVALA